MADEQDPHDQAGDEVSRREFVKKSVAAGIGVGVGVSMEAQSSVVETDVTIKTPDGMCDAAFIHPSSGAHPAVIIWTDAFGLRPSMRGFARRLAADGYSVLVPNPFYRVAKAPVYQDASGLAFANELPKIRPLMASINAAGTVEKDAPAFVAWLDTQASVAKNKKIGTQGYCMGGALVMRTAATLPDRIGAGASFHGGGLVTDQPTSPHLLAPKIKARMYFGVAGSDDMQQPAAKDALRKAFADAKVPAEVELFATEQHGWCVPDMPKQPTGAPIYEKDGAERAWSKLTALYKTALV